jgi:heme/copper-type cytochrome/quinol oxidase subunit 2
MNQKQKNQDGFITMIVCIVLIVAAVIYFAWKHVAAAQH